MLKWNEKILFSFRLGSLILVLFFLIFDLVLAIVNPQPQFAELYLSERVSNYYAFFTTQSNYIVAIFLFAYLFESKFRNKKPTYIIRLAVTTYITVTMLVFWFGIFTQSQDSAKYTVYNWLGTIVLHLVIPIGMISSYILTAGDIYYSMKKHHHLYLWLVLIYPLLYFIIVTIRGELRYEDNRPLESCYPYFFLNVHQHLGWLLLLGAALVICTLFISLQYLYIYFNNILYNRLKGETLNKIVNERFFGIKEGEIISIKEQDKDMSKDLAELIEQKNEKSNLNTEFSSKSSKNDTVK